MESRKATLIVNKGGSGSSTFRVTVPSAWIRQMGLGEEDRDIKLKFDGETITIKNNEEEVKMMKELVEKARVGVEKEITNVGFIDDSDEADRFLDNLANELLTNYMCKVHNCDSDDLDYEIECEIEELQDELIEAIKDEVMKDYNKFSTNENGHYGACYYKENIEFENWDEFNYHFGLGE